MTRLSKILQNAENKDSRYFYKLIRIGAGVKYPRGNCMATVLDVDADPLNCEFPLPNYKELAFEWGERNIPFRNRENALSKSILYHYYFQDFENHGKNEKLDTLVPHFRKEVIELVPFEGVDISEAIIETWLDYKMDELGM